MGKDNVVAKNRGRPRLSDETREESRRAILDAAFAEMAETGPAGFNARDVAHRAGVSTKPLYAVFGGMEELRLEVNALTMLLLRDALQASLSAGENTTLEARLMRLADAYVAFSRDHRNLFAALFERRTIPASPEISATINGVFAVLEGVLRDGGAPSHIDIGLLARALWSSVHGMVFLGSIGGLGPIHEAEIRPMIEILVRSIVRGMAGT